MNELRDKAQAFSGAVREWVGDSPTKATVFGLICAFFGYLSSYWPL